MHNNISYEEYMRTVLGYNPGYMDCMQDTYQFGEYYVLPNCEQCYSQPIQINQDLEKLYPEIYVKLYPTVCKKCSQCTDKFDEEILERMTNEVYDTIYVEVRKDEKRETRQRDNALRDLIKILILRELIGSGFPRPPRPPFPGPGPRPPHPPFPGPGPRPPRPPFPGPNPR